MMHSMQHSRERSVRKVLAAAVSRVRASGAAVGEVAAIAAACLALAWVISQIDLAETVFHWTRAYEVWELDELPYIALVLACGFGIYAFRWRRQYRIEMERRVEAERRRADALQAARAANRAKSTFLATMSHELRTPLNAILGFSEIIRSEEPEAPAPAKCREYADGIHKSGAHLLGVIDAVLDMAKIEACCIDLAEADLDVGAVVGEAAAKVGGVARARNVRVELALGPLPPLRGDERALKQVLTNVLANAVKYNVPGGSVVVDGAIKADGELWLTVQDTGIGIAAEDIPNVIKPFVQIRETAFVTADGTGLGMAIADQLVAAHGGRLEITSKPKVGTAVTMRFPARRVRPVPSPEVERLAS